MTRRWVGAWRRPWLRLALGIAGALGLLLVVVAVLPPLFVRDQSLDGLKAQNEVRATLLQGLAGMVLLLGALFTYRQLHTAREGQITERYTRAIEQLGHAQLDVRLGGIYALERIARDSPHDRATIGEVLTAFVRSHAPWPPSLPGQYVAAAPIDAVPTLRIRAPDVQASLTVLGRAGFSTVRAGELDLGDVDLRHAILSRAHMARATFIRTHLEQARLDRAHLQGSTLDFAHLDGADLIDAHLEAALLRRACLQGAIFHGAHLEGADLQSADLRDADFAENMFLWFEYGLGSAHLEGAILYYARLEGAILRGAHLEGANLEGAHLGGADLQGAHLGGANLRNANLEHAGLHGTELAGADLEGAHLDGARADERTDWPAGFDWREAGVIATDKD